MTRIDPRSAAALLSDADRQVAARSDGERTLETHLRQRHAPPFEVEWRFDAARKWRFDFAWPAQLVAVEVEGGQWVGGHGGDRFELDCVKYSEAAIQGWLVVRVTTAMVEDGRAVTLALRALWARSPR